MPNFNTYTEKYKLNALANGKSLHSSFKEFKVDRKCIRKWLQNEDILRSYSRDTSLQKKNLVNV